MLINFLLFLVHTFYISLLTLEYKPEQQKIEYTLKLTAHDTEKALANAIGEKKYNLEKQSITTNDSLLSQYVNTRCLIEINGNPQRPHYIGYELDDEELYIFQEIEVQEKPTKINIFNSLLLETFDQQVNEVIIKGISPKQQNAKFSKEKPYQQLDINN